MGKLSQIKLGSHSERQNTQNMKLLLPIFLAYGISAESDTELSARKCRIYTSASSITLNQLISAAEIFDFIPSEYKNYLNLDDFDESGKQNILSGVLCEQICSKTNDYCKSFKRDLSDEEFEQVAMFKGLLKKSDMNSKVQAPINVAKK